MYRVDTNIPQETIIKFFKEDPSLCYLGLPDYSLVALYEGHEIITKEGTYNLGVYLGDELVFLMNYTYFTDTTINIHTYLKTKYQHTPMYASIQNELRKYFLENTKVIKVIAMTPETCPHIHKTCEKYGFTLEGRLTKAIIWREKLVDLLLYGLILKEEE